MQTNLLVKRFLAVLAMVMMPVMFLSVGTLAVHAQQLNVQQRMAPAHSLVTSKTVFVAPQVSITCGGAIGSATDGNGAPINWTFNTQQPGQVCVTVTYNVPTVLSGQTGCDIFFYVPNRDATGDIFFHFNNGNTVKLNENPVSGFVDLGDQESVSKVTFTDVNDQATNSVRLGWGTTASFGIKAVCFL